MDCKMECNVSSTMPKIDHNIYSDEAELPIHFESSNQNQMHSLDFINNVTMPAESDSTSPTHIQFLDLPVSCSVSFW